MYICAEKEDSMRGERCGGRVDVYRRGRGERAGRFTLHADSGFTLAELTRQTGCAPSALRGRWC